MNLSDKEFSAIRDLMYKKTGLHYPDSKKYLIVNRLSNRIKELNFSSAKEYINYVELNDSEFQIMINKLTTNETYFFREEKHFEFIREHIKSLNKNRIRIWSAASSSGEEAYSIAMLLEDMGIETYEILGSDINEDVVREANAGEYPIADSKKIPQEYLKRYCIKGVKSNAGKFKIKNFIRNKVSFKIINLKGTIPVIGKFDIIFLRNVLIYFDREMKYKIVKSIIRNLHNHGLLILSQSESIIDFGDDLSITRIGPSIFQYVRKHEE